MTPPKIVRADRHLTEDRIGCMSTRTYCGQAYFAGSGPAGKTCRECACWAPPAGLAKHAYAAGTRQLKPCRCRKYTWLTGGRSGGDIPHGALACRYFEPSDSPPPPFAKR
jgi:hypothetical protein